MWARLSCRRFKGNQARLQLFALACNQVNFLRQLALPRSVRTWTLTTLREKRIKLGARVAAHAESATLRSAEAEVPRAPFVAILVRMPSLPIMDLDLLYCAFRGKDKSGQGMHAKAIGRSPYGYVQGRAWKPSMPRIHTIIGGRLTAGSHGNAIGVGLCQFIMRRFEEAVDWERTAVNCLSALTPNHAQRPILCVRTTRTRWSWRSPCARRESTASARPSSSARSR